ncbi:hypothetical protein Q428_05860 [Fervidicella metallireducens AeB]|uniref:FlgN protein n=1 Tax=Fervidicella metallireducens AeB TaxID=1403537 RepID=A0A017RVV3_9CLOT|nr:flagellar protein FlgN [Fervidicella metallireducens]EYE88817.1 hypothetical protein Q428_05860 [Fervidicella metallireducens AeB]
MNINEILTSQITVVKELSELLDYEKEVLKKDLASELPAIIEGKKEIARKIAVLEKNRQNLCGNKTADEMISEGIVDISKIEELRSLINIVKEKDETNLALTKQSLNYIRMITFALNPNNKNVVYKNNGAVGDTSSTGIFTTTV